MGVSWWAAASPMAHFGLYRIMCSRQATQNCYRFEERITNKQERRKLIRAGRENRSTVLRDVESWNYRACDGPGRPRSPTADPTPASDIEVIVMSASGTVQSAVEAMKYDYMSEPFGLNEPKPLLDRVTTHFRLKVEDRFCSWSSFEITLPRSPMVPQSEAHALAASACATRARARGVLRTCTFIFANRRALSGSAPAASQNSAAWSAKASG